MRRNSILLVVFAAVLITALWFRSLPGPGQAQQAPAAWTPARPCRTGEFRGISLQLHNGQAETPYETYVSEIARTGANTVNLVLHGYQEDAKSSSIFIDGRKTPSDERLRNLIRHAHREGLRVMLMPVVLLARRHGNDWRGKITPDPWNDWWREYSLFLLHYARLAGQTGVDVFSVGSELISTETQTDRWKRLIAEVRKVYPGRLTYSANWDHYKVPQFWGDLDMIGMTSYFTLGEGTQPCLEDMLAKWKPIKSEILEWQKTIGRPILFTEVGWPNQISAAEFPWNYYASPDKPDPDQQAACFESFFRTWRNEKAVAGFLIWEWRNHPNQPTDPKTDTSYCPVGKPAMRTVQKHFLLPATTLPNHSDQ